jgi:hypothetical protein
MKSPEDVYAKAQACKRNRISVAFSLRVCGENLSGRRLIVLKFKRIINEKARRFGRRA